MLLILESLVKFHLATSLLSEPVGGKAVFYALTSLSAVFCNLGLQKDFEVIAKI